MTAGSRLGDDSDDDNGSIEYAEDVGVRVWDLSEGYRTCPECGRDCEPVPFGAEGKGVRVSMICPLHGVHTVVDPFEGSRRRRTTIRATRRSNPPHTYEFTSSLPSARAGPKT